MKLVSKIAIVIGLIVCISSCQKEIIPVPAGGTSSLATPSGQRLTDSTNTGNSILPAVNDGQCGNTDEIVGGGDDDRDGGGKRDRKGGN